MSKEQLAEATARVKAAGLADRVTLMFCDYREVPGAGTYDKVSGAGWLLGGIAACECWARLGLGGRRAARASC